MPGGCDGEEEKETGLLMNRYYTDDAKRKISAGNGPKLAKAGASPAMPDKAGPFPGCPGPCQGKNRSLGVKKVKVYAKSEGL